MPNDEVLLVTKEDIEEAKRDLFPIEHKLRFYGVAFGNELGELEFNIAFEDPLNIGKVVGLGVYVDADGKIDVRVGDPISVLADLDPEVEEHYEQLQEERGDEHYTPNLYAQSLGITPDPNAASQQKG